MAVFKKAQNASIRALAAAGLFLTFYQLPSNSAVGAGIIQKTRPAAAAVLGAIGRPPADQHLHLAIGLPLRNESELSDLLRQLYDPASSQYRQWWTPAQLAERYGATEQDCQAVRDWAEAHHLTVKATHSNR